MHLSEVAPQPQVEIAVAPGREGVIDTLRLMRRLVRHYKKSPEIRNKAESIIAFASEKNWAGEVESLFSWVQSNIRYTLDTNGIERLQTPEALLASGQGDCDDKATLLAAMLEAVGHPSRFVAVGFQRGELSHVFVEARIGEEWVALDATEPHEMGWRPPGVKDHFIIHN